MRSYSVPMVPHSLWARISASRWTPICLFILVLGLYFLAPVYRSYDFDEALEHTRRLTSPSEGTTAGQRLLERALVVQSRGLLVSALAGLLIGLLGGKVLSAPIAGASMFVAGALGIAAATWPLFRPSPVYLSSPCPALPRQRPGVAVLMTCVWERPQPAFWLLLALLALACLFGALLLARTLVPQRPRQQPG